MSSAVRSLLVWSLVLSTAVFAAAAGVAGSERPPGGIWKYAVPPAPIRGQFDNEDPVGLAAGVHLKTDCSMNWVGEDGKVYCFTTGTSLEFFVTSPAAYISAAQKFFAQRAGAAG